MPKRRENESNALMLRIHFLTAISKFDKKTRYKINCIASQQSCSKLTGAKVWLEVPYP